MQTGPEWYKDFFHGIAVDFWRQSVSSGMTEDEVDFLEATLQRPGGSRFLDVPCGFGRHSLLLAARGYRMAGVDISEDSIREAQASAATGGLDIELRLGDMRELAWGAQFDGAFCMGNSFGFLDYVGTREFVRAVALSLKPGARFIIDTGMAAESIFQNLQERDWFQAGDIHLLIENRYQVEESRMDIAYAFFRKGAVEKRNSSHWVFTVAEICRMLEDAGLAALWLFSSLDREPFQLGDPRLFVVAEKQ